LAVAHARSGLFVEAQPDTYAFSHQNFREYLAASRLIGRRDAAMAQAVAEHAADAWWEEVFLLAIAYPGHYDEQREYLLECLRKAGHLVLAGLGAVDAGARLPAPLREQIKAELHARMIDASFTPNNRYAAGEAWDELGGLPDDLDAWVLCPKCADGGGDLLVSKYPVTNAQFRRFIEDRGYENLDYWGGEKSPGWLWRMKPPYYRGEGPMTQPEYWEHPRLGKDHHGYPVVGVSWYEAAAYAKWLAERRQAANDKSQVWCNSQLEGWKLEVATSVRLPTEDEWLRLAGGEREGKKERYPWDVPASGRVTDYQSEFGQKVILERANTHESGIGGTSPVAMYPLGASQPHGLWDIAGNVWEWTDSPYDKEQRFRVVRGGAWYSVKWDARTFVRYGDYRRNSNNYFGFRLVSPITSGS
jgi:formylglycine-generating enzyme required for sulfatase activity